MLYTIIIDLIRDVNRFCIKKVNFNERVINMNKEDKIVGFLLELFRSGALKPGDKIPSEYELAERFEVNKSTANKAVGKLVERGFLRRFRGAAGTVLEKKALKNRGTIAYQTLLLSGFTFCAKMLKGAALAARANGYAIQYYEADAQGDQLWDDIADSGALGVLSTGTGKQPINYPLPVMHVGSIMDGNYNSVHSDDYQGAVKLAELLLRRGHRSPVMLFGYIDEVMQWRLRGFTDVFRQAGISAVDSRVQTINLTGNFNPANVYSDFMRCFPDCTVALCASDHTAIKMVQYLELHGISVPEQFSVTGFANMQEYQSIRRITTVDQFPEDIGYTACQRLIELLEQKNTGPVHFLTHTEVLKGDTVGLVKPK